MINIINLITAGVIIESPVQDGWLFISMFFLLLLGLVIYTTSKKSAEIKILKERIRILEGGLK